VGKGCIAVPKYSTTQNIKINKISQQRAETINLQWKILKQVLVIILCKKIIVKRVQILVAA
jgi:hypothetical protein